MRKITICLLIAGLCLAAPRVSAGAEGNTHAPDTLSLEKAEELALSAEPRLDEAAAKASALRERAVADAQLPDPQVSLGLNNFPVDNFSTTREGMTQITIGAQQQFMPGQSLRHKGLRTAAMADASDAERADIRAAILREVRHDWLELYYWLKAEQTLEQSDDLLRDVIDATETLYGTGRRNSQDIIGAELERDFLKDRQIDVARQIAAARARLSRWAGEMAAAPLPAELPGLNGVLPRDAALGMIGAHPAVRAAEARMRAGDHGVYVAEEQYKPGFSIGIKYGLRNGELANGSDRADFASAMVNFSVPIFTDKRQDRAVLARKHEKAAARLDRDDTIRNLTASLNAAHASRDYLDERIRHYETDVVKRARESFDTAVRAYRDDLSEFSTVLHAQLRELEARLKLQRLRVDMAKTDADILYLQGGAQ